MALVVENGSGLTFAESYASVAEADAYFAAYGNETWSTHPEDVKEIALRKSTRDLDLMYGAVWNWPSLVDGQSLLFPRFAAQGVPNALKRATMELAAMIADGYEPFVIDPENEISEKTVKVDVIETSVKYSSSRRASPELERIRLILGSLVPTTISAGYARVVRG